MARDSDYFMGMNNKLFPILRSIMILCLLLASCGGATITRIESSATPQATRPAATGLPAAPLSPTHSPATDSILTIGLGWGQDRWVRNFNPFSSSSIFIPEGCIYEPLMLFNSKTGALLPWLATGYSWGENNQTLAFTLRKGVQWSDGQAFSSEDVAATFKMLRDHPDINGIPGYSNPLSEWLDSTIADISTPDAFTVVFRFKSVNTLALYQLATEVIVPKHIWEAVESPTDFTNPDPVGTGAFTEVTIFEDKLGGFERILQLERNPHYWQQGEPHIQGVKFSFRHDENIIEDLAQGKVDWTSIEIPDIQKDFLDKDPSHDFHALLETGAVNFLYLNTARPPFDNPDVRKAISMGIDRQQIIDAILPGYLTPANATGLGDRFKSWWNQDAIRAGAWVDANASQAGTLLDKLGFKKGGDGVRMTPAGAPMRYTLMTESGDPNQAAVAQVISKNLANIGVSVSVVSTDNWWDAFTTDNYDMALFSTGYGYTPYEFYDALMSPPGTPIPGPGAKTNQDAGRYYSAKAGGLLSEFIQLSDPVQQKMIMDKIQMVFVEDAPTIPLYPYFWFDEYNTARFTGFPSTEDPYADGSAGNILVLLNVKPR